jgi:hypothetical protein
MTIKYSDLNLEQIEAVVNKIGGMDSVQRLLADELVVVEKGTLATEKPKQCKTLLREVTTVSVGSSEKFVAAEHFTNSSSAGIKFWLGDNFKTNFFGKIEENVPAAELNIHTLTKASLHASIRAELGAEHEETKLTHLYELLKKQPKGESAALLTNGIANIFYIRDTKGELWAVHAYWDVGNRDWYVYASSVAHPSEWHAGHQVVSRKSAD